MENYSIRIDLLKLQGTTNIEDPEDVAQDDLPF